jgi:cytochrome c peroxidase
VPRAQLDATLGRFKTPGLRNLVDSGPYLHTGSADRIEDVLGFYAEAASRARRGALRNADPELPKVHVNRNEVAPLAAFLRALTEDYE